MKTAVACRLLYQEVLIAKGEDIHNKGFLGCNNNTISFKNFMVFILVITISVIIRSVKTMLPLSLGRGYRGSHRAFKEVLKRATQAKG